VQVDVSMAPLSFAFTQMLTPLLLLLLLLLSAVAA
jgi:hypothetical protein